MATFEPALSARLIYVVAIDDEQHKGCLKIGETQFKGTGNPPPNSAELNAAADSRIKQYTQTAGIAYTLHHTELSLHTKNGKACYFKDHQVHNILRRSKIKRKKFEAVKGATEWYCCNLETVKKAIAAAKKGRESLNAGEISNTPDPIVFRPEQLEAIEQTKKQFKHKNKMLWNAKMRFGKTLCALRVAKDLQMQRTIIITHRPVVNDGWSADFNKIFSDTEEYRYGSSKKGERSPKTLNEFADKGEQSLETLNEFADKGGKYVFFTSIQDLRGSKPAGGSFDKNNIVFDTTWDLLIIDEAHEGTQTGPGQAVISELTKKLSRKETKILLLSGTPFNLLDNLQEDEIFTWDYVMEQTAKKTWNETHLADPNPYASLPAINIYTYDLGTLLDRSSYIEDEKAFNFREFFRTQDDGRRFVHDSDVDSFLNLLCKSSPDSLYPYSDKTFRDIFRHTLWVLPGVNAARALSEKLKEHEVFKAFKIVNVAGTGDGGTGECVNALTMVKEAIGEDSDETYTITITCGRLTTGVSVPAWTAVFMMAGSFSTSAAGYMQTIFRVQTPYTHNGRMKEQCYAFDFAPDRTLRVWADVAKKAAGVGKTAGDDRKFLGDFLNFCPIIAIEGSEMKKHDVNSMMGQLKKVQIERVVRGGFEGVALYNDKLEKLTNKELQAFSGLKKIIGTTRAMHRSGDIDINQQGLTNELYAEMEALEKKKKKERTPEEQRRLEELKAVKNQRREAISILRGISIRMPLLLYGADIEDEEKELTIDNFTSLVDDLSWEEFMPKGVTKELFAEFKGYYDSAIFSGAGKRIREMVRAADEFSIEVRIERIADIFATFRNPDKETVLTPWRVVNMHLAESLGGYCFYDEEYQNTPEEPRFVDQGKVSRQVYAPESRILEINSKTGLYPLYAAYSIYRARVDAAKEKFSGINRDTAAKLWDLTLEQNVLVVCKTPMARSITIRTLAGFRRTAVRAECYRKMIENIIKSPKTVANRLRNGKGFWNITDNKKMKIDAIIGNPPYQITTENTSDKPVYNLFIDLAARLSPRVTLITPARYLFNAGKTPKDWNEKILNDEHFKVVWYKANSTEVFPNVDIKGGVAVMYRDTTQTFGKIGHFITFPELNSIYNKAILQDGFAPISDIIYPQNKFCLERLYEIHPSLRLVIGSNGSEKRLTTSIFDLNKVFTLDPTSDSDLKILGLVNNIREYRYIDRSLIEEHPNLEKYKVIVPKSNGSGAIGEVLSTPLIGEPLIGVTQSFITIGAFDTEGEAAACLKYVKTKFARTLLGILKATQDNPKDTWRLVPLQDFTTESDIDWAKSVEEIDDYLYGKYKLSPEEIDFIERMIKPMT